MSYFTDREFGQKSANSNEISIDAWNGIVAIFKNFISDNSFSKAFPEQCPDGYIVCGFKETLFYDKLKAHIPKIEIPIDRKEKEIESVFSVWRNEDIDSEEKEEKKIDTYTVLDFIEFCYNHLSDSIIVGEYHNYFKHHHFEFNNKGISKHKFRSEINILFERNGIAYHLDIDGKIYRRISDLPLSKIKRIFLTKDDKINELLHEGTALILLPKETDRKRAMEKIWDAFERIKSIYDHNNKKNSAEKLISLVAKDNDFLKKHIETETKILTDLGNKFQIRHFEMDTQPITELSHIDYLFFRMFSLIDLFLKELEK